MRDQLELEVEERTILGKHVGQLRRKGMVPANLYGHNLNSVPLQVNALVLQKLLAQGGNHIILLRIGNQPATQALIKKIQRNPTNYEIIHVDFYRLAVAETLKARVQLHFVNESGMAKLSDMTLTQALSEVMVECHPADLPVSIQVDLSMLAEAGATIRVENLIAGPGVTILTDSNETVACVRQRRGQAEDATAVKTADLQVH